MQTQTVSNWEKHDLQVAEEIAVYIGNLDFFPTANDLANATGLSLGRVYKGISHAKKNRMIKTMGLRDRQQTYATI